MAAVKEVAKAITPPSSPFAELLRRSRFATFDPSIRQSYYTPPDHAYRGDWGLKRPLSLRRRNAFISIPAPFDSRAQYIEWSNAEKEVRFMRRFEEMEVSPTVKMNIMGSTVWSPWEQALGTKNLNNWVLDSEFGFPEEGVEAEEMAAQRRQRTEEAQNEKLDENLTGMGKKGPRQYGSRRQVVEESAKVNLTPNIFAMSPKEFDRYVRKIRELRPQFREYVVRAWEEERRKAEERQSQARSPNRNYPPYHSRPQPENRKDPPNLLEAAQDRWNGRHIKFLELHTASTFADPDSTAIEQRPHQVAGLLYARLSPLHSRLHGQAHPGIVLQSKRKEVGNQIQAKREEIYVASLGGLTPVIHKDKWGGKRPLLDTNSDQGIDRNKLSASLANMRLTPGSVVLQKVPRTVGAPTETEGLMGASISSEAEVQTEEFGLDNPYMPGSMLYSVLEGPVMKQSMSSVQEEKIKFQSQLKRPRDVAYTGISTTPRQQRKLVSKLTDLKSKML